MADPVEEQVNIIIDDIDRDIAGKHPFTLRDILERPGDFRETPDVSGEIDKLKGDIAGYFGKRKEELADAMKTYQKDAAKASKVADQIADAIKAAAKTAKKSVIAPLAFARNEDKDEVLFIDNFEDSYAGAISALVSDSLFVVDASLDVDGCMVGRWVFPSATTIRNRALFVSFPVNPGAAIDVARDQMLMALDAIKLEVAPRQ